MNPLFYHDCSEVDYGKRILEGAPDRHWFGEHEDQRYPSSRSCRYSEGLESQESQGIQDRSCKKCMASSSLPKLLSPTPVLESDRP